jgi:hypothetical protein
MDNDIGRFHLNGVSNLFCVHLFLGSDSLLDFLD